MAERKRNTRKPTPQFSESVAAAITARDVKRADLAQRMGVSIRYFDKMVAGTEFPARERVEELAGLLGMDRDTLLFNAGYLPDDVLDALFTIPLPKVRQFVKRQTANG